VTTDARGRFAMRANQSHAVVAVSKPGWSTAYRAIDIMGGSAVEMIDARLTFLAAPGGSVSPVLGGSISSCGSTLSLPAGALVDSAPLTVSPMGQQGLAALLPLGWSPV